MSSMPYNKVVAWSRIMRPDLWSYFVMPTYEHSEARGQKICVQT
jgi:hypothetical protein